METIVVETRIVISSSGRRARVLKMLSGTLTGGDGSADTDVNDTPASFAESDLHPRFLDSGSPALEGHEALQS